VKFGGHVPMTPFEGLLNDEEVAAVLTYVRNTFGNKASAITAEQVKKIRDEVKDKKDFFTPSELLRIHPLEE
jgi:mono/diheme cytochrome c family protein